MKNVIGINNKKNYLFKFSTNFYEKKRKLFLTVHKWHFVYSWRLDEFWALRESAEAACGETCSLASPRDWVCTEKKKKGYLKIYIQFEKFLGCQIYLDCHEKLQE